MSVLLRVLDIGVLTEDVTPAFGAMRPKRAYVRTARPLCGVTPASPIGKQCELGTEPHQPGSFDIESGHHRAVRDLRNVFRLGSETRFIHAEKIVREQTCVRSPVSTPQRLPDLALQRNEEAHILYRGTIRLSHFGARRTRLQGRARSWRSGPPSEQLTFAPWSSGPRRRERESSAPPR